MKVVLKIIASFVVVVAILAGLVALVNQGMPETKEVSDFNKKFELVQLGDPEAKALSVLGKPGARESEFRLGQKKGFENAYSRAEASGSVYYLLNP